MSELSGDTPEEATFLLKDGRVLNMGDRVVVVRVYRKDDDMKRLEITDETMARFMGSHVLTYEGETLFGGMTIPLIEVELDDGSKENVWGFECDWMAFDDHATVVQEIEATIPDHFDP